MKSTRKRLVGVAAALSAVAAGAPVSTASAVPPVPIVDAGSGGFPFSGWGGFLGITPPVIGPVDGAIAVVGPTVITTAPSSFVNVNNQDSAGGNWAGAQWAP
jgi:hypothetical protein